MNSSLSYLLLTVFFAVAAFLALGFLFWKKRRSSPPSKELEKHKEIRGTESLKYEKSGLNYSKKSAATGIEKTREFFRKAFDTLFLSEKGEQFYDELEGVLLSADLGVSVADSVVQNIKKKCGLGLPSREQLKGILEEVLLSGLPRGETIPALTSSEIPQVILIVGVNGAGKTTSIAKLINFFKERKKNIIIGAADTYRAAATAQLESWTTRLEVEGVFQKEGADPSAVAFDTVSAAVARRADICIIDTAGRLHTKSNLMDELKKMKRVVAKAFSSAPQNVWLVIDGSVGQNAIHQAKEFHDALGLTGIIVTKLDGSAKGGSVFSLSAELRVPILFVGTGESVGDFKIFDSKEILSSILESLQERK